MPTQLQIYNAALTLCGETQLADLTEEREARYVLDGVWNNGAIQACLEAGQWNFGIRAAKLEYEPTITLQFGYQYAFQVPEDWVRWAGISDDPYFKWTLEQYQTDNGFLFCDLQNIYVRYISNDPMYGFDMSLWPQTFCRYVEAYLAFYASIGFNKSDQKQLKLEAWMEKKLADAEAKDVQQEAEKERPPGYWARSRRARFGSGTR